MGVRRAGEDAVSRRAVLGALGLAGAAAALAACGAEPGERGGRAAVRGSSPAPAEPGSTAPAAPSVAAWQRRRGPHYYVAHRGSGDVYPEHTIPAYQAAVDAGAPCMEVSVAMTSDGVLICMHDLSYDRTTTGHGVIADQPSSVLEHIGVYQARLGPYWVRPPLPAVPLLADVLRRFGRRTLLCLDAKDDRAYPSMMALVERLGLRERVIVKAYRRSPRIAQAKAAGYPVFVYLGPEDMNADFIAGVARGLDAGDSLVLPATPGDDLTYYPDGLVTGAVSHGVPVWVYPVHRRADAAHYFALGVAGAVTSSYAYVSTAAPLATRDGWSAQRIAGGEMTRQPESAALAPRWTGPDAITLATPGTQQFLTLGQLAPLSAARGSYTISFAATWPVLPADLGSNLSLAFGHADDAYYDHRSGRGGGYHAIMRPDGRLELYRHDPGQRDGVLLAAAETPPVRAGQWLSFRLDVTPGSLRWARTDTRPHTTVSATDTTYRGGYLHIGRSAYDDRVSLTFRDLTVAQ